MHDLGRHRSVLVGATLAALVALALGGCESSVLGGSGSGTGGGGGAGGGDDGDSTTDTTTDTAATGAPTGGATTPSAVSFYESELPEPSVCEATGCGPDLLFLLIDSNENSCEVPYGTLETTFTNWSLTVGLPRAYQQVGTYQLEDPAIFQTSGLWIVDNAATGAGGFGVMRGTIEILSIDATSVRFAISGIEADGDGEYVANRCGASEPETP